MKKKLKLFYIIIFNIIVTLYLSELLLTIFLFSKNNVDLDQDYIRYVKAKKLGIDFDKRTNNSVGHTTRMNKIVKDAAASRHFFITFW